MPAVFLALTPDNSGDKFTESGDLLREIEYFFCQMTLLDTIPLDGWQGFGNFSSNFNSLINSWW
ncbi:hypothetical protein GCM10009131_07680 [Morganella psychrotolerans]